eukprot:CAMPEP_0170143504 /NCGR_PEP_ID=MMETSP0033_2-20121228/11341_1 /TAXON_ID=195969 /ORGANISM="Dolichomastix tenuilepis, Strain CCMP3274" /LENGTH=387 /DNA_ID=CAMNT_0010379955 /DNA_START=40 /DNA_END=1203 /DNA_ORIENTATION=+
MTFAQTQLHTRLSSRRAAARTRASSRAAPRSERSPDEPSPSRQSSGASPYLGRRARSPARLSSSGAARAAAALDSTARAPRTGPPAGSSPTLSPLACRSDEEAERLLLRLTRAVANAGTNAGLNLVAFSGGVDSSLSAWLVRSAFGRDHSLAVIGVSPALPADQLQTARAVAQSIDIPLLEVPTNEGSREAYVANEGQASLECKNVLSTLTAVATSGERYMKANSNIGRELVLYNGTNADDMVDPTRLGLVSAARFQVVSPLARLTKAAVRQIARKAGLPNWNLGPCLRSRLQLGVPATAQRLRQVEEAEKAVRAALALESTEDMRVRVLQGGETCTIEIGPERLEDANARREELAELMAGLHLGELVDIVEHKSGRLATFVPNLLP